MYYFFHFIIHVIALYSMLLPALIIWCALLAYLIIRYGVRLAKNKGDRKSNLYGLIAWSSLAAFCAAFAVAVAVII